MRPGDLAAAVSRLQRFTVHRNYLTDGQMEVLAQLPGEKIEKDGGLHFHPGGACSEGKCSNYRAFH